MITKKGFNVFVAIVIIVSSKACFACFSENHDEIIQVKAGEAYFKKCYCEKIGYSVRNIKWIDPHGRQIEPLSTNTAETYNMLATGSTKDKLHVVELTDIGDVTGTNSKVYTETEETDVSLNIDSMSKSTSGAYVCETEFEGTKYRKMYYITASDVLYFVNTNTSQHVVLDEDSLIRCEIRGSTQEMGPTFAWYLEENPDESIGEDDEKYYKTAEGLVVRNVSKDDEGTYICTAEDPSSGNTLNKTINIEVKAKPIISNVTASPEDVVLAGSNVTLQCLAEGTPYPGYLWTKISDWRGVPILEQNATWRQDINKIIFENIQKEDAGTFECNATNDVGSDQDYITIVVHVAPEITLFENVNATEGSIVQIVCRASGEPIPNITISYHGHADIRNDPRIQSSEPKLTDDGAELYLTFNDVIPKFEGIFSCQAENHVDTDTKTMNFTVFYKPHFDKPEETIWGWDGKTINMNCEHKSNPPSKRVWSFQGNEIGPQTTTSDYIEITRFLMGRLNNYEGNNMNLTITKKMRYGVYECVAKNEFGEAKKTVYLREALPPGAIKNVTLASQTASSMTFHIEGPDHFDGPPVLGYEAQYYTSYNFNETNIHNNRTWGLDRKFTIERLKPNTTYRIKFAAKNEAGVGMWTDTYEFDTPETSVPEPPTWDESQPGNLRWKSPEANGNPIDHYIIEYCPFFDKLINHSMCKVEKVKTTEFPLDGLDRSRTYSFKIWAHNVHGVSDYTDIEMTIPEKLVGTPVLTAGAIIGLSIVVVFLLLLLLDLLLLAWRRQGIIASCCLKKNKKKDEKLHSRDKKGLLVKEGEAQPDGSLTRPNNGHKEFEYNKTTGIITGKHSTV